MRFLRLLILIPALCLGLLGQGHGWVLCEAPSGSVRMEMESLCNCENDAPSASYAEQAFSSAKVIGTCHDTALDPGHYVSSEPVKLPSLDFYMVGWLVPTPCAQEAHVKDCALPCLARGPPGQWHASPPQVLACVRSVVMVI